LDNSEWMRNGDYVPSRLEAMQDAANLVSNAKMQANAESTVGVMSLAGKGPEVLVSPTDDMGKILNSLHDVSMFGRHLNLADGVQVAALALKHRRNKNGGQRIVVFIGSPIEDDTKSLTMAGKALKKNNIAVDVVSIGQDDLNQEKLEEFVKAVNQDSNSNLVTIPAGCVPADVLMTSPIVNEGMAAGAGGDMMGGAMGGAGDAPGGMGSGGGMGEFSVDPNMDPELAMALRVSMEEERARQEQEAARKAQEEGSGTSATTLAVTPTGEAAPQAAGMDIEGAPEPLEDPIAPAPSAAPTSDPGMDEDEELLQQALALSMKADEEEVGDGMDEDMQRALQMSMQSEAVSEQPPATPGPSSSSSSSFSSTTPAAAPAATPAAAASATPPGVSEQVYNSSFVRGMLSSLPGVDLNDPRVQEALRKIQDQSEGEKNDGDEGKK